jgi:rRNA maturation protein Nop10
VNTVRVYEHVKATEKLAETCEVCGKPHITVSVRRDNRCAEYTTAKVCDACASAAGDIVVNGRPVVWVGYRKNLRNVFAGQTRELLRREIFSDALCTRRMTGDDLGSHGYYCLQ